MIILKREVSLPRRSSVSHVLTLFVACSIFVIGNISGFYRGLEVGSRQVVVTEDVRPDAACGITDPIACAVEIMESVAEMFRPMPEFTVTVTPTSAVDCRQAERAYYRCVDDVTCPTETFEAIADDVNFCQTGLRR